jgi:hypothetical protein
MGVLLYYRTRTLMCVEVSFYVRTTYTSKLSSALRFALYFTEEGLHIYHRHIYTLSIKRTNLLTKHIGASFIDTCVYMRIHAYTCVYMRIHAYTYMYIYLYITSLLIHGIALYTSYYIVYFAHRNLLIESIICQVPN